MTEYYRIVNGEPMLSLDGMALLHGIEPDVFRAEFARQRVEYGLFEIPVEWLKQGRRIAREAMAATGSPAMKDAIDYLARGRE